LQVYVTGGFFNAEDPEKYEQKGAKDGGIEPGNSFQAD